MFLKCKACAGNCEQKKSALHFELPSPVSCEEGRRKADETETLPTEQVDVKVCLQSWQTVFFFLDIHHRFGSIQTKQKKRK